MCSHLKKRTRFLKQSLISLAIAVLVIGLGYHYLPSYFGPKTIIAHFETSSGGTPDFSLEIAATEGARRKGLMFRKAGELGEEAGMIFIYPKSSVYSFWMKNTYIPLDMIFINEALEVVGVAENVPPLTLESRKVDALSRYIIELNGGIASKYGIKKGAKVKFLDELPVSN